MSVNWGKLHAEGRCREVGTSWTEKEAVEIFVNKTATVDEVRARYYPEKIAELQVAIDEATIDEPVVEEAIIVETETKTDEVVEVKEEEKVTEEPVVEAKKEVDADIDVATKEVEEIKIEEVPAEKPVSSLDNLKKKATDLGIQFAGNIGEKKLKKRVEQFKAKS